MVIYLALATASLLTLRPWCDEAWFSSPALNLLTHGHMGTSVLDPTANWRSVNLTGIRDHTYWIMPMHVLVQAAWYSLTGFGLFPMRALSVLWGLAALGAWYGIMKSLTGDKTAALLTMGLIAIDFQFLWGASAGRMDMMAAALAFLGLAAYLRLRDRNPTRAWLAGHSLIAAAFYTHPVTVTAVVGLVFMTLYFDRFSWRMLLAVIPYLAGGAAWGLYILQNPVAFFAQFAGNASDRWAALSAPLTALKLEFTGRYLAAYGLASAGASRLKIILLIAYAVGVIGVVATAGIRRHKGHRVLLILTGIYFLMLPALDGFRQSFYLVHTIPMLVALLAAWLVWTWKTRSLHRPILIALLASVVTVQLAVTAHRVLQNPYQNSFVPAGQFLTTQVGADTRVFASAEWAFLLGFNKNLVDDYRLGYRSGGKPDLIVVDQGRYADWIARLEHQDPANYAYIQDMLTHEFHVVYEQPYYKVYARTITARI